MKFSKASELKKYIGHRVEIEYAHDRHRGTCLVRRGVLDRVEGRNIVVSGEHYWFTDVKAHLSVLPNNAVSNFEAKTSEKK